MRGLAEEFRASMTLPVLVQGETSKGQLLAQFVAAGNALLVATSSFGRVDVRGDALSCVIIDKLPFTSPDDPLLKARIEDCRLRGGDPFNDVQLPDAVITLKQGVGRLIRDIDDRGVLVICDNRLVMRPYGAMFLNSLPRHPGHGIWRKPSPFSSSAIKSKEEWGVLLCAPCKYIFISCRGWHVYANFSDRYCDRSLFCCTLEQWRSSGSV